jgi:hypothetical protein
VSGVICWIGDERVVLNDYSVILIFSMEGGLGEIKVSEVERFEELKQGTRVDDSNKFEIVNDLYEAEETNYVRDL